MMKMKCPRCHNTNVERFYLLEGQYYCRECIPFQRVFIEKERQTHEQMYEKQVVSYHLDFELSQSQKKISHQLVMNYQSHKDTLVLAVCGSGKTEMTFELICYVLSMGQRVCFCIPRKELVKELYWRMKEAFRDIRIGLLYGNHIENEDAQFIICTMHQLYRFENGVGFHLMIADEVDAFPFYQNNVLNEIFKRCCLNNYVKMSATFSQKDVQHEELLILNRRYHHYDLPVPRMIIAPLCMQKYLLKHLLKCLNKKTIVYVPTISLVSQLVCFLCHHFQVEGVSSLNKNTQEVIQRMKKGDIQVIISTTLLERGVTIEDVQVIIYQGQHGLYDEKTLIQMAGRVGRKVNHPHGFVYILTSERTKAIQQCIKTIKKLNRMSA